jgi:hypothetical protein
MVYFASVVIAAHAVLAGASARKDSSKTVRNEFLDGA